MGRHYLYICFWVLSYPLCQAQSPDNAYHSFSKGYANLDAKLITSLYTSDALLVNLYENRPPESYYTRDSIFLFFESLFVRAREEGISLAIDFHPTNRQVKGEQILDNGYYHLEVSPKVGEGYDRYGKFSILLRKQDGKWKFHIDTNASASQEEYEQALWDK
ncbi:MAG: hypothetical protein AAF694_31330 [Bacteroidota bacterium]